MHNAKKKNQFEEQFEDSEANFSECNAYENAERRNEPEGEPVQLIQIKRNGKIEINEDALGLIASYNSPVGFVSLVGKMRTGKSCLLNRLLQLRGKGFKVDPSVSSCTQGIWMWTQPQFNPTLGCHIFFLDTEGTDSLEKDIENDTKIFTLSLLISSFFVYNSVGSIDERSLSQLEMVTALSKQIKTDQKLSERDNQQNLYRYMPKFLWILRDFTLRIEDERGKKITASQYLENCLTDQNASKINEDSRKVKKSIMNYFKDRECMTLVRPVGDESQLQRLNSIPDHALRREFIEGINVLRQKLVNTTGPKTFEGQALTGPAIASMIESYVDSFNSDKVPNIRSAWQQIAEDEGAAAFNRAVERYEEIFREEFPDDSPKGEEIYRILSRLREESLKEFDQNSYGQKNQEYLAKLKDLLKQKEQNILQINNNVNEARNHQILKKHAQKLKTKIQSNKYSKNKEEMQTDLQQIIKNYNAEAKGQRKADIITQFVASLTPVMLSLDSDNTAQQEEKRRAKIKMDEYEKKLKLQNDELQSMRKQIAAKKNADDLKIQGGVKPMPDKSEIKKKQKKDNPGCCSGEKCIIM